ncbi:MAG: RagB/SusD family nutrient uptake outer membrane protein [Candidatus Pseudobacter hemicellulosilyticus]|uniref:RagB/SusD family nutrient uptake outer membrane protein n=1 Tax=Candidatus Pseudobacter hemicellulosilyticus TaxID=3121375 RepID=A0AAJ6BII6_9BACT|nr:MAG: RagB/SusD family nutrient uptake outer membrane protein [Pseudobacter sp.]
MKNRLFILLCCIATSFVACDKYLDVKPKGLIIPEKLSDYADMLNSNTMTRTFPINLLDFTDDIYNHIDAVSESPTANGYYWRPIITINEKTSPDAWGSIYRCLYNTNVIINGVPDLTDGTPEERAQVVAEAQLIKANCYLELLTVFAKSYNPATAATDPGLPLVTSIDVTDKAPARSSLQATLDTILNLTGRAAALLPASNVNRYRGTRYAAYGLLSRVYLYMGDYTNAATYTDKALEAPHSLLNYNDYADYMEVPVYDLNPEVLWQRGAFSGSPIFLIYSDDLNSYFNADDIRYEFLTVTNNNGLGRASFDGQYSFGIGFPELYLTKAELLARQDKFSEAIDIVNMLRQKRIVTSAYTPQSAASGPEAMEKVLAERRRELAFSGLRWFDMKRFDREGRMPEIKRINKETNEVLVTLAPHSDQYTFEIPVRVQLFNPDMELNHP